jgi:hypothetical protein
MTKMVSLSAVLTVLADRADRAEANLATARAMADRPGAGEYDERQLRRALGAADQAHAAVIAIRTSFGGVA